MKKSWLETYPSDSDLCTICGCCRYAHAIGSGDREGNGVCMIRAHNKCTEPIFKAKRTRLLSKPKTHITT
jgi:hypothetical protein